MKIKTKKLLDPQFWAVLTKIASSEEIGSLMHKFQIARLVKSVEKESKAVQESLEALREPYELKDEDGKPQIFEEDGKRMVKLRPDKAEDFNRGMDELLQSEQEFDIKPIKLEFLDGASVTAADLLIIEELIEA